MTSSAFIMTAMGDATPALLHLNKSQHVIQRLSAQHS
jgi:hypothetical protein